MTKALKGFPSITIKMAQGHWVTVAKLNQIAQNCGFQPIFVPTVETKTLFQKTLGSMSDISKKEFFHCIGPQTAMPETWVLRPELTTGVINHLLRVKGFSITKEINLFAYGSCFRYENPQGGRYREFFQWNLEQLNSSNIADKLSRTLICLHQILLSFKIIDQIVIEINYLSPASLANLKAMILNQKHHFSFCALCQERLTAGNVYLILDCKDCGKSLTAYLNWEKIFTSEDKKFYDNFYRQFQEFLPKVRIMQKPTLTRGLDYYSGLVFEVKIPNYHWSQNTIIAGGTYDMQIFSDQFFPQRQGFGFAIGINRFVEFLQTTNGFFWQQLEQSQHNSIMIGFSHPDLLAKTFAIWEKLLQKNLKVSFIDQKMLIGKLKNFALQKQVKWLLVVSQQFFQNKEILLYKFDLQINNWLPSQSLNLTDCLRQIVQNVN